MIDDVEHLIANILEDNTPPTTQKKPNSPHTQEWAMDVADKLLTAQSIGSMAMHGISAPGLASLLLKLDGEYFNESSKESWEDYIAHNLLEQIC